MNISDLTPEVLRNLLAEDRKARSAFAEDWKTRLKFLDDYGNWLRVEVTRTPLFDDVIYAIDTDQPQETKLRPFTQEE